MVAANDILFRNNEDKTFSIYIYEDLIQRSSVLAEEIWNLFVKIPERAYDEVGQQELEYFENRSAEMIERSKESCMLPTLN